MAAPMTHDASLSIETFAVGPLGCNCTILADPATKEAIVIDPGGEADTILRRLSARGLRCKALLHTHTHFDHVGASAEVQRAHGAAAMLHEKDLFLYKMLPVQAALFGMLPPAKAEIDGYLADGRSVRHAAIELGVLHTPGHTPGSVCLVLASDGQRPVVFAGDTLFAQSIGRTDLWGGDAHAIVESIRGKLFALSDDTLVVTGHGPSTTIGAERRSNPFVGQSR